MFIAQYVQVANWAMYVHGGSFRSEDADDCKDGFCGNDGEGGQLIRDAESYMIISIHDPRKDD